MPTQRGGFGDMCSSQPCSLEVWFGDPPGRGPHADSGILEHTHCRLVLCFEDRGCLSRERWPGAFPACYRLPHLCPGAGKQF